MKGRSSDLQSTEIRNALPSEAPRLHALLTEAFAEDVLPFTIYRDPRAVSRLAELAGEGRIRVADNLEGLAITTGSHLDYLAVDAKARGKGIGRRLMDDLRCATLDVLADNPARRWYESLGFQTESVSHNVRLAPKNTGSPPETWGVALREERAKGFSAVGHAGMRIGLLGGIALRLLDAGERSPHEALEILGLIGCAGRGEVVVMGIDRPPVGYDTIQIAQSVRMRKKG